MDNTSAEPTDRTGTRPANLPVLSQPIPRLRSGGMRTDRSESGPTASGSSCDGLTGLAQQMCFAVLYDV